MSQYTPISTRLYGAIVLAISVNLCDNADAFQSVHSLPRPASGASCSTARRVLANPLEYQTETEKGRISKSDRNGNDGVVLRNGDIAILTEPRTTRRQRVSGFEIRQSPPMPAFSPPATKVVRREQSSRVVKEPPQHQQQQEKIRPDGAESVSSISSTMPGFMDTHRKTKQRSKKRQDSREEKRKSQVKMYQSYAAVPDSLIEFTSHIHAIERVTPKQEEELGLKSQEATHIQSIYDSLEKNLGRQPTSDEWCAASGKINMESLRQTIQDGLEAKNRLVTANLRLVQRVVNVYLRNGLGSRYNAGDLMQEGTIALIRAAEKFEPSRGFRFSTYAMYWIRSSVKRSQLLQSREIVMPQRQHENYKKARAISTHLEMETGTKPTLNQIAKEMNMTDQKLLQCYRAVRQEITSLDQDVTNGQRPTSREARLTDFVASKQESDYFDAHRTLVRDDLIGVVRSVLGSLEADIVMLRFGLIDERLMPAMSSGPLSIAEVSIAVGLKPDKVRRLINNSLSKLRPVLKEEWLVDL
eukprot:CAMPEP_0194278380 /NCGR_PEP_ID=MMETSP0169-20130528/10429_1 /TAXON_ID=218684 /ORGANISM="Corethron pennatum, Strain L29A3" /LENGTH=526 /DNA_ID=CAMNT_0039022539 /DNA_START=215 /DNA_END=1795 /DNA_ORIENTATION=+